MIKAVFIDYTGTTVMESGADLQTAVIRICKNCVLHDPKEMLPIWWKTIKKYEADSYQDGYLTSDEVVYKVLNDFVNIYSLKDNLDELYRIIRNGWATAPLFSDVKEFYDKCPLPLFVITNNSESCVDTAMRMNDLHPAGIVSADSVRAYKPHKELFEKALETAGCNPEEAVHIGDSYNSDVLGARAVGIRPILIQREEIQVCDNNLIVVNSLKEVLNYLKNVRQFDYCIGMCD